MTVSRFGLGMGALLFGLGLLMLSLPESISGLNLAFAIFQFMLSGMCVAIAVTKDS